MIRYTLRCAEQHEFDGWFGSSDAYDRQAAAGQVTCAVCGSTKVEKAVMAPAVPGRREARPSLRPANAAEKALAELRRRIETNCDYVGREFAAEARRVHDGSSERRGVWGEASGEEARKLREEGVPVVPLPFMARRND